MLARPLIVCLLLVPTLSCESNDKALKQKLAILHVAKQGLDFDAPWMRTDTKTEAHMATSLGKGFWLTTAFAVKNAVNIQLQRDGNPYRVDAKVHLRDFDLNLAIIRLVQPSEKFTSPAVSVIDADLEKGSLLKVAQVATANRIELRSGQFSKLSQRSSVIGPYLMPTIEIEIAQKGELGWSEPVFADGKLAGLTTGTSKRYVTAISAQMLRKFIEDSGVKTNDPDPKTYQGLASIGIQMAPLTSPYHRQQLGAEAELGGVLIKKVLVTSWFKDLLQVNDILVGINGHSIDERGEINLKDEERIHFTYLVAMGRIGEIFNLDIIRGGKQQQLSGKLGPFKSDQQKIPFFREADEPFVIFGGLVFQELSQGFLKIWGNDWQEKAPVELLMLWRHMNFFENNNKERFVVLNRILPDQFNRGYEGVKYLILNSINDIPVKNLGDLSQVLKEKPKMRNGQKFAAFEFALDGGQIVLPYAKLSQAHERIQAQYNIQDPDAFVATN